MCYMKNVRPDHRGRPLAPGHVGVRELRQNLSVYLERVITGERLAVTDRGRPVAMLVPLPPAATLVERIVAEGRAIPAERRFEDLPPLKGRIPSGLDEQLQLALRNSREDRL
jgi:prevent-host-death family protein